ncbi:MAG TPA: lysylphosphatidylglycerol synthase transmembrane domain-containing protein, partial [Acidimicrobiales bacterium]|nr:lysylphosphatidylglycerol synthase transmembrane domain-containing protein [Acidimicrobiales bacterium]
MAVDQSRQARPRWKVVGRRLLTVAVIGGAIWAGYDHRSQLSTAGTMLSHLQIGWLLLAVAFELASMVVFARLQRWLLRAGGVTVPLVSMIEIAVAGNAMSTSLPGGPAWSATWAFGQLRRRGANRVLAGWVIVVAGALSSFAIFVIVAGGAWVAGNSGPFAHVRWLAAVLAAIPVLVALGIAGARHNARVRAVFAESWQLVADHLRPARAIGRLVGRTSDNLELVHPGLAGWLEAFGLALANWLYDAATLVACIEALHVRVPWHAVLIIYGFTQISASIPITPGGLGVVEASMAALLVAYGTQSTTALAVVLLYRIVSFWGLV